MSKIVTSAVLACVLAAATFSSLASEAPLALEDGRGHVLDRDLDYLIAPIKSAGDLKTYLATNKAGPLDILSLQAKRDFVKSLRFNEKGLVEFRADILENELTVTQVYQVLALFGEQNAASQFTRARIATQTDEEIILNRDIKSNQKCFSGGYGNDDCGISDNFLLKHRCESAGTCVLDTMRACTSNC